MLYLCFNLCVSVWFDVRSRRGRNHNRLTIQRLRVSNCELYIQCSSRSLRSARLHPFHFVCVCVWFLCLSLNLFGLIRLEWSAIFRFDISSGHLSNDKIPHPHKFMAQAPHNNNNRCAKDVWAYIKMWNGKWSYWYHSTAVVMLDTHVKIIFSDIHIHECPCTQTTQTSLYDFWWAGWHN